MTLLLKSGLIVITLLILTSCASIDRITEPLIDRSIPEYVLRMPTKPATPVPPRTNGEMYMYRKEMEQYTCKIESLLSDVVRYATRGEQNAPSSCGD